MIKVKICGITSLEDALLCLEEGADALGFIFYPQSKRYLAPVSARSISLGLPRKVKKIGVFVNESPEQIVKTADYVGLDAVQLHGNESRNECFFLSSRIKVIRAVFVSEEKDVKQALLYKDIDILFDSKTQEYGGSGRIFSWEYLKEYRAKQGRFILSGGLTSENVFSAIEMLHPYMVDVSSGVEFFSGKKDPEKVKAFMEAVRKDRG